MDILTTYCSELIVLLWIKKKKLVAAHTFNHNCAYGLALTDNRDEYLVARKTYFTETSKQTIQPELMAFH